MIYAVRRPGGDGEETLLILATPAGSDFTDKIYRLRWQIEVTFRGLKTAGFNLEGTHLSTDGHFQNMLMLLFIAYAAAYIDGLIRAKKQSIPIMKSNGRRRFSIFSFGLDVVVAGIIRNVKFTPKSAHNFVMYYDRRVIVCHITLADVRHERLANSR